MIVWVLVGAYYTLFVGIILAVLLDCVRTTRQRRRLNREIDQLEREVAALEGDIWMTTTAIRGSGTHDNADVKRPADATDDAVAAADDVISLELDWANEVLRRGLAEEAERARRERERVRRARCRHRDVIVVRDLRHSLAYGICESCGEHVDVERLEDL